MNAIKFETVIDEVAAQAIPPLRPLLGRRVELIALEAETATAETRKKLSFDELLALRLEPPPGVGPLSDADSIRTKSTIVPDRPNTGSSGGGNAPYARLQRSSSSRTRSRFYRPAAPVGERHGPHDLRWHLRPNSLPYFTFGSSGRILC
jgi:hypothetical protein